MAGERHVRFPGFSCMSQPRPDRFLAITVALSLLLAGCGQRAPTETQAPDTPPEAPAPDNADRANPSTVGSGSVDEQGAEVPNLSPPVLTPEAERGKKGARNVLLSLARMIELEAYDQAWDLLARVDDRPRSENEFAALFAGLQDISVQIGDGVLEGAAGSSYYNTLIVVTARDAEGRPVKIEGPVVLRRVNDVPGANAEDLRWHITSLALDKSPRA